MTLRRPGYIGLIEGAPNHRAAFLPATVPLDHAHWKLNADPTARPCTAIGHYAL
jgi:hypothetical protein